MATGAPATVRSDSLEETSIPWYLKVVEGMSGVWAAKFQLSLQSGSIVDLDQLIV